MTLFIKQPVEGAPLPHGFARWCRAVDKALCGLSVTNGRVSWSGGMPTIAIDQTQQPGFPYGKSHPWGLVSLNKPDESGTPTANVVIAPGEFQAGNGQALATPQSTFTIAADASYIGLQYTPGNGTLSLIGPTTDKPIPGGGAFRVWLYLFAFNGTRATFVKHNLTGNWHAAMYAFEPTETEPMA